MPLSDGVRALLERPNFAHVATLLPDGGPHSVAVWVGVRGDQLVFFTQPSSRKARNLDRDPRVAVSLVDRDAPYRTAFLRGRVAGRLEGEEALVEIDRLSQKYTGRDFPMRGGVVLLVEVERDRLLDLPFEDTPAGEAG
jgi:PPOX class probable F420-dependent enzyme